MKFLKKAHRSDAPQHYTVIDYINSIDLVVRSMEEMCEKIPNKTKAARAEEEDKLRLAQQSRMTHTESKKSFHVIKDVDDTKSVTSHNPQCEHFHKQS